MLIYFVCLFITVLAAHLAQRSYENKFLRGFFIFVVFAVMVLLPGMRDASVGTDTGSYVFFFNVDRRVVFSDLLSWDFLLTKEAGYSLITVIAGIFSNQYWSLLMTIAALVVFCHLFSIYKFSINPVVSLFVFISLGYYTFFFNGARQGIAGAIYTLSFGALIDGKFLKYAFWVIVASLFHKTAIVAIPLYFLFRMRFTLNSLLVLGAIAIIGILTFDSLLNLGLYISVKYALYQKLQATGAQLLTLFFMGLGIFFIIFRSFVSPDDFRSYDIYLNMFLFGSLIYTVVLFSGGYVEITRMAVYFQFASIFLWPILFRSISLSFPKLLLAAGFVTGHLVYFYIFLGKIGNLIPYEFNVDLVRWF